MSKVSFRPALSLLQIRYVTHPPRSTNPSKTRPQKPKRMPNTKEYGNSVGGQYGMGSHDTVVGVAPISQKPSLHELQRSGFKGPRHPAPSSQDS